MIARMPWAIVGAVLVHGAFAFGISQAPRFVRSRPKIVQVKVNKITPPVEKSPPKSPEPPKPEPEKPEPPKPKAKKPEVAQAPPPNSSKPPPEPPKTPPKPVFGVSMDSTVGDSTFSVPTGNTTVADPKAPRPDGPVQPLGPAPPEAKPAPVWKPASEAEIAKYPDYNEDECTAKYPDGEAKQAGIEGETVLRVQLEDDGGIRGVRVLKGVGHGLDDFAVKMLKTKCKFTPAVNKGGKKVPYELVYTVTWKLD